MTWSFENGIPWAYGPSDGPVLAGLVLGYGYAHQSVAQLGIANAIAGVLRRELARPIESDDGGVLETAVAVHLGLQDLSITLGGDDPEVVRRQLLRLDTLLRHPEFADLSGAGPGPRDQPADGWVTELTAWLGMGPATLTFTLDPQWSGEDEALRTALGSLHPSRGMVTAAFTTDPTLVGTAFTADTLARPGSPLRWRDAGPASILPTYNNNLLSARVDTSPAGAAAERLLIGTFQRTLALGDGGQRLVGDWLPVDQHGLLMLRAQGYDGYDAAAVHQLTVLALEACRDLSDERLQEQIDAGQEPEHRQTASDVRVLAAQAVRTGQRQSADEARSALETLTVPAVRAALGQLLDRVVLGLPDGLTAPTGYPLRVVEPGAVPTQGRRRTYVSNVAVPVRGASPQRYSVSSVGSALTVTSRAEGHGRQAGGTQTVDLQRVVARLDWGAPGYTMLLDDDNRQVVLPWGALKDSGKLRVAVDAAVPPERRLVLPAEPAYEETLRQRRRFERRVVVGVTSFLALVLLLIIVVNLATPDDQPTTKATVAVGTSVSLANGTTVAVANPRSVTLANVRREFLVADVTFCGGGPTYDGGESEARNSVAGDDFYLDRQIAVEPLLPSYSSDYPWLTSTSVTQGQCHTGTIGYGVPARPAGTSSIRFGNASGDVVDWTF